MRGRGPQSARCSRDGVGGRLARRAACLRRKNGHGESTLPGGVERSDKKTWLGMRREAGLRVERRVSGAKQNHHRRRSMAVWSEATKRHGWACAARPACASSGAYREQNKITTGDAPWRCGAKRQKDMAGHAPRGRLARRAARIGSKTKSPQATLHGGVERSDKKTWLGMRRETDLGVERRASGAKQNHHRLRSMAVWSEATKIKRPGSGVD